MIRASLPSLLGRLEALKRERLISGRTGIVLIKKVVFDTLAVELSRAGYRVLQSEKIDFPKYGKDLDTVNGIKKTLESLNADDGTVG
jgi:pyruvate-formate lyase